MPRAPRLVAVRLALARVAAALVVVVTAACASSPPRAATTALPASPAAQPQLDVDITLLPDDVGRVGGIASRVCPRGGRWPRQLVPENRRALGFVVSAVDDDGRSVALDGEGLKTRDLRGCLRLVVDVGALADAVADKDIALRAGDDLIVTPDLWLWRPEPFDDARLYVRVVDDRAGFTSLLPWTERVDGRWVVDRATFALKSDAVFGTFAVEELTAGGATFRVARLADGPTPARLAAWLTASAEAVGTVLGRYPVPSVNVLVVPLRTGRPVVVAFFSRGGGPTATIFTGEELAADADPNDLDETGRWALTHELAHALLPPVRVADAWLNEGLATFHQELLARRAGLIADDAHFWHELMLGLDAGRARAQADGLTLAAASSRMHETGAYQHAYWGGVAVLLVAEVNAQRRGASLDDLVRTLRTKLPRDDEARSAEALLALAAAAGGKARIAADAVRAAFKAHKDQPFPELEPLLLELGIASVEGRVVLDDAAPLAAVRRAMTGSLAASSSLHSEDAPDARQAVEPREPDDPGPRMDRRPGDRRRAP